MNSDADLKSADSLKYITPDKAFEHVNKSLLNAKKNNDRQRIALSNSLAGTIKYIQGDFENSYKYYFEALRTDEEIGNKASLGRDYHNIGMALSNAGKDSMALSFYFKSIGISLEQSDRERLVKSFNSLGISYMNLHLYDSAVIYMEKAADLANKIGKPLIVGSIKHNLAMYFLRNGNTGKALKLLQESLEANRSLRNERGIATNFLYMAQCMNSSGNTKSGLSYLDSALSLGLKGGFKDIVSQSYLDLSSMHEKRSEYQQALDNLKSRTAVEEEIFNAEASRQITDMQTKYDTEKKVAENQLLTKENAVKDLEISQQKVQKYVLIGSVLVTLLLSVLIYNRYKLKQQKILSEELLKQEKLRLKTMVIAQETERKRIAGELHDGIGQMLSAVKLNVAALAGNQKEEFDIQYKNALGLIDDSCVELRNISHAMMPGLLVKSGLIPALKDLADKINNSSFLKIFIESDGMENRPHQNIEIQVYRIIQELLNNIMKYADAKEVHIQLNKSDSGLTFMMEDDGKGFDKNILKTSSGNGWNNINSRLEILNASLEIDSQPGRGTVVFVEVPGII